MREKDFEWQKPSKKVSLASKKKKNNQIWIQEIVQWNILRKDLNTS